jgi:hypothetical protein
LLAAGVLLAVVLFPEVQPWAKRVPAAVAPAVMMNLRLEKVIFLSLYGSWFLSGLAPPV